MLHGKNLSVFVLFLFSHLLFYFEISVWLKVQFGLLQALPTFLHSFCAKPAPVFN